MTGIRVLAQGFDTLKIGYVVESYKLTEEEWNQLQEAKEAAQSKDFKNDLGGIIFRGQKFEVNRSGGARFEFILNNADICVQINKSVTRGKETSQLMITFRSAFLWRVGADLAALTVKLWVESWAVVKEKTSRADYCFDLNMNFPKLDMRQFVSWARKRGDIAKRNELPSDIYYHGRETGTYEIGRGGVISFRMYDKVHEIGVSHKEWFKDIWIRNCYDQTIGVTRFEFQLQRKFLHQWKVNEYDDLKNNIPDIMKYLIGNKTDNTPGWLTIRELNENQSSNNRTWELAEVWKQIQNVYIGELSGVERWQQVKPKIEMLQKQIIGCTISIMALLQTQGFLKEQASVFFRDWFKTEMLKDKTNEAIKRRINKLTTLN